MTKNMGGRGRMAALAALGLLATVCIWGCNRGPAGNAQADADKEAGPGKLGDPSASDADKDPLHFLRQSFAEATRADQYSDWEPVQQTRGGKSIGHLYEKVKESWAGVKLVGEDGKKVTYIATLDTDMGPIEITLRPDLAPNHVRSFVALIQAGYYDGLVFERCVTEKGIDSLVELIEGGDPAGGINPNTDGIGYWLKPEIRSEARHEEGTVGAPHGEEQDTAACRFYIMVSAAPVLDGHYTVFGKVTKGMDVAKKIFRQPVIEDIQEPPGGVPVKPVVIRKTEVRTEEFEVAAK
jgi:cyclophilin family peptidyl-prolyl cis-trans isomerase